MAYKLPDIYVSDYDSEHHFNQPSACKIFCPYTEGPNWESHCLTSLRSYVFQPTREKQNYDSLNVRDTYRLLWTKFHLDELHDEGLCQRCLEEANFSQTWSTAMIAKPVYIGSFHYKKFDDIMKNCLSASNGNNSSLNRELEANINKCLSVSNVHSSFESLDCGAAILKSDQLLDTGIEIDPRSYGSPTCGWNDISESRVISLFLFPIYFSFFI